MFFPVSKLFWLFAEPINFLIVLGFVGAAMWCSRFARCGRRLTVIAVVLLAIAGFSPLGALLSQQLEDRFPPPPAQMPAPFGIIVLGGAIDADLTAVRGVPTLLSSGARLTAAAALARRFPNARLVFTGGSGFISGGASEAPATRNLWLSLGIPAAQIIIEGKSRNTWENAQYTRALLHPMPDETWLLVTSAWHMPRAMGVFRKAGFNVIAYPVDYRSYGDKRDWYPAWRALDAMTMLDDAMHEWIGLVAYRLRGKTDNLFPAP
jgi:uncharacterized SAM-binding protein YcdF (DUF218 family)